MMQLTSSTVFFVDGHPHTLFTARQDGYMGVVCAGSWEIVLPFRYERIEPLSDGCFVACRRNRRTLFRPVADSSGIRLIPLRHTPRQSDMPA